MFPEFKIVSIDALNKSVIGSLNRTEQGSEHWIDENWIGSLLQGTTIAFGRWFKEDSLWRFAFDEKDWGKLSLSPRVVVYALDGYWGERVELVYDKGISWQKAHFVIADGVDHVHCDICWATISEDENREYYKGGQNYAVCKECYTESVGPKRLNFVPAHNNSLQARRS